MSYRVGISNGTVTLQLFDGIGQREPALPGPAIAGRTSTTRSSSSSRPRTAAPATRDSTDPYAPPLRSSASWARDINCGTQRHVLRLALRRRRRSTISGIAPADSSSTLNQRLINNLSNPPAAARATTSPSPSAPSTPTAPSAPGTPTRHPEHRRLERRRAHGELHRLRTPADRLGLRRQRPGHAARRRIRAPATSATSTSSTARSIRTASPRTPAPSTSPAPLSSSSAPPASSATGPLPTTPTASSTTRRTQTTSRSPPTPRDAYLAPLAGHELEGTSLYINGYPMPLTLVTGSAIPRLHAAGYTAGSLAAQLQRRLLQAAGDQHVEHDPPAVPGHRRHVRPARHRQRALPRRLPAPVGISAPSLDSPDPAA